MDEAHRLRHAPLDANCARTRSAVRSSSSKPRTSSSVPGTGYVPTGDSIEAGTLQFPLLMATFDQLSAEQRAIVELVLQQGKTYEELSGMLGMPEPRVRELARDALVDLAPVSVRAVEEDWRGQLADYVLGQQAGAEAAATKGHLRRSEAARSWTRSLLDSLEGSTRTARCRRCRTASAAGARQRPRPAAGAGLAAPDRRGGQAASGCWPPARLRSPPSSWW